MPSWSSSPSLMPCWSNSRRYPAELAFLVFPIPLDYFYIFFILFHAPKFANIKNFLYLCVGFRRSPTTLCIFVASLRQPPPKTNPSPPNKPRTTPKQPQNNPQIPPQLTHPRLYSTRNTTNQLQINNL